MSESPSIYERIAAAYVEIAEYKFKKDGRVKGNKKPKNKDEDDGGYKFIKIEQILDVIRSIHSKHGIIVLFGKVEFDADNLEERRLVKKPKFNHYTGETETKDWYVANGHIHVRIFGAGGDCIEVDVSCEGMDNADKLTNKLITNAERNLYRTLYSIDGDDAKDPEETNVAIEEEEPEEQPQGRPRPRPNDAFFGKPEPVTIKGKDEIPSDLFVTGDKLQ